MIDFRASDLTARRSADCPRPNVSQRLEPHGARVEQKQAADKAFPKSDDFADHFQRHHAADDSRQRAENARFGAGRHGSWRRRFGKQATVGRIRRPSGPFSNGRNVVNEASNGPTAAVTSGFRS